METVAQSVFGDRNDAKGLCSLLRPAVHPRVKRRRRFLSPTALLAIFSRISFNTPSRPRPSKARSHFDIVCRVHASGTFPSSTQIRQLHVFFIPLGNFVLFRCHINAPLAHFVIILSCFVLFPSQRRRRLAAQVRLVFADYYSCTDVRETTKSLGFFLQEAIVALELAAHFSRTGTAVDSEPSPARLASRLKVRLRESSEKLTYHLDGDDPMVLYRFWTRFVLVLGRLSSS